MELLFATTNPHKLRELWQLLTPLGVEVRGLDSLADVPPEPSEDGATFEENARKKARGYAHLTGMMCLAEDSGLEIDALGGAPGVHSARYSGVGENREERDHANNEKILHELAGVPTEARTARFVSALCLVDERGRVRFEARGTFEGRIAETPSGDGGFGYDPLFYVPELGRTSAQLSAAEKNARSHRGAAVRAFVTWLEDEGRV